MKKLILTASILCLLHAVVYAQQPVIYKLAGMKAGLESIASEAMKNEGEKAEVLKRYNKLRAQWDAAISQFQYDLNRKNKFTNAFEKINQRFVTGTQLQDTYPRAEASFFAKEINKFLQEGQDIINSQQSVVPSTIADFDPIAAVGQVYTMYKDWKDRQKAKADGLSEILDNLRLRDLNDKEEKSESTAKR